MKRFTVAISAALLMLGTAFGTIDVSAKEYTRAPYDNSRENLRKPTAVTSKLARVSQMKAASDFKNMQLAPTLTEANFLSAKRQRPAGVISRSFDAPRGSLNILTPNFDGMRDYSQAFYGSVDVSNGKVTPLYSGRHFFFSDVEDYLQTGCIRDNILYLPVYTQDYITLSFNARWRRVDLNDGTVLPDINFGDEMLAFSYSLTYDSDKDLFYTISYDTSADEFGAFAVIDPNVMEDGHFKVRYLGNVGGVEGKFMTCLCYNPDDKHLYGIRDNGEMGIINPENGAFTISKQFTDDEYYCVGTTYASQPLAYSPKDKSFVTIFQNDTEQKMELVYIDYETGESAFGESLDPACFVAQLFCLDRYANDDAPAQPVIDRIDITTNNLSGSVTFTVPEFKFNGIAIGTANNVDMLVTIDDKEVFRQAVAPGKQVTADFTVEEGNHEIRVIPAFGELVGPYANIFFYAGDDTPLAPKNVKVDGNTVSWTNPGAIGFNKGYVNAEAITYNVYFDNTRVNNAPITGTSFTFETPADFARRDITVTATYNGKESLKSDAVNRVFGSAMNLPLSITPTEAEASLFQAFDNNHDGYEFGFDNGSMALECPYYSAPNDWLFMPLMKFDDVDALYTLSYVLSSYYPGDDYLTDLDIYIGKAATPQAMTTNLESFKMLRNSSAKSYEVSFVVPEAGDYYIGFHAGGDSSKYRGLRLKNLNVKKAGVQAAGIPADPTDVTLEAAPNGELAVNVTLTAPTTDLRGNELKASEDVQFTLASGKKSVKFSAKPGSTANGRIEVEKSGYNQITLTPANNAGSGIMRTYNRYVGLDVPVSPGNLKGKVSKDNMSIEISWDAPTEGANGGYVNPSDLTYRVYELSGVTAFVVGTTTDLSYTFAPGIKRYSSYYVGPTAANEAGESTNANYLHDFLGVPYEVPMTENFGSTAFDLEAWTFNTRGNFNNYQWQSIGSMDGYRIGDPVFNSGGLVCLPDERRAGQGELFIPKFTTTGCRQATFGVKYWVYQNAPKLELWGRTFDNQDFEKIGEIPFEVTNNPHWADLSLVLPQKYQNAAWVHLALRATFDGRDGQYACIDNLKVFQNVDNDLRVNTITGPAEVSIGDRAEYLVTVANSGQERINGFLTISLEGDGKTLDAQRVNVRTLNSGQAYQRYVTFGITTDMLKCNSLRVKAEVEANGDEVENNNILYYDLTVRDPELPTVNDLKGKLDDNGNVTLTWTQPATEYGNHDSFEISPAFLITDRIGIWKNIDLDKEKPFCIEGARWQNDDAPSAWTVINGEQLGFMSDPRLAPHSGKQYVMARSIQCEDYTAAEEQIQASDWLISPEIVGGSEVSFWFGTIDGQYFETIEIWVSTTDDNIESFTKLRPFTKTGDAAWEQVTFNLPDDARYFAFRYASYAQWGAMIDDVEIVPVRLSNYEIEKYSIWAYDNNDWETYHLIADNLQSTSYVDNTLGENDRRYFVVTSVIANGDRYTGPKSNVAHVMPTGIDDIKALEGIFGAKASVIVAGHANKQLALYGTDGKLEYLVDITADNQTVPVDAGIYIAKIGNAVAKVVVR